MKKTTLLIILILVFISSCTNTVEEEKMVEKNNKGENLELATFAGGCFWCMEAAFEEPEGVINVVSGYSGEKKRIQVIKKFLLEQLDIKKRFKLLITLPK